VFLETPSCLKPAIRWSVYVYEICIVVVMYRETSEAGIDRLALKYAPQLKVHCVLPFFKERD